MSDLLELHIVKMAKEDIKQIAEIEKACFSTPWSENAINEELFNPLSVFFVAKYEDTVVGYIGMHHVIDEGFIANVAVSPQFRQKGIAKALIQTLIAYAEQHALSFITLEVRKSNQNAINLYTGQGFITEGERRHFYEHPKEDAYIMTKRFL